MADASFYIMTYNQERFAALAIRGAFAQDYPGLEIIISDDCSTDGTWDVILQTVEECKKDNPHGHKVVLNRNETNMGICAHINKIISLASHDVIFCSAGDDISCPERVSKCMELFHAHPDVMLVNSRITYINESGDKLPDPCNKKYTTGATLENIAAGKSIMIGCANACRKQVYEFFGNNMPSGCSYEDVILAFRAALLGAIRQIPDRLVLYRMSENSLTNFDRKSPVAAEKRKEIARQSLLAVKKQWNDLHFFEKRFPGRLTGFAEIDRILQHQLDKKEQTLWLYQYPLREVIWKKLKVPHKGKPFFQYLREAMKKQKQNS